MPADDWVTVERASWKVGKSVRTINRWAAAGDIRAMRINRRLLVFLPDVREADAKKRPGRPPAKSV